jgi:hypothetical protein
LRVFAAGQDHSGGKLDPRPVGLYPNRGEKIVDDPRMTRIVGNKHLAPVASGDAEPFAAVAGVGLAPDPLMKLHPKLGIPAHRPPTDVRPLEALVPGALRADRLAG